MTNEKEVRYIDAQFETRAEENEPRTLTGYAALFNDIADIGYFREMIQPGAFRSALTRGDDVRALFNHDPNHVLGRTKSGTLQLWEDSKGLGFKCLLPDSQTGNDLWNSIKRGDISQCSFAFSIISHEWRDENTDSPLRVIKDVELWDVSAVTYPAYENTRVSARAIDELKEIRQKTADGANAGSDNDDEATGADVELLKLKLNLKEKEVSFK